MIDFKCGAKKLNESGENVGWVTKYTVHRTQYTVCTKYTDFSTQNIEHSIQYTVSSTDYTVHS